MEVKIITVAISLFCIILFSSFAESRMISEQNAIDIATKVAKENKYNPDGRNIETLRVNDGHERGPVRLFWLVRRLSSQQDEMRKVLHSKFWIIYFYPKEALEFRILDGGYCVLVDINTGESILHFND